MARGLRDGHRLLTEGFGVDPGLLHATVFGGGEQLGPDTESLRAWQELGVPVELRDRSLGELPGDLVEGVLGRFGPAAPPERVREALRDEERRFADTLDRGRRVLARRRFAGPLDERDYRYLHGAHGLPRDLVDLLREPAVPQPSR